MRTPQSKAASPFLPVSEFAAQTLFLVQTHTSWAPRVTSVDLYYNIRLTIENRPLDLQEPGLAYLRAAGSDPGPWCTVKVPCVSLENRARSLPKALLLSVWSRDKAWASAGNSEVQTLKPHPDLQNPSES